MRSVSYGPNVTRALVQYQRHQPRQLSAVQPDRRKPEPRANPLLAVLGFFGIVGVFALWGLIFALLFQPFVS